MTKSPPAITELLMAWRDGRSDALDQLLPLVYEELLRAARRFMRRERHDHTLEATALVHEMYARLVDVQRIQWRDRAHFLAMAATLMRRILIEFARSRHVQKRGAGQQQRISLTEGIAPTQQASYDVLALHEAVDRLTLLDARRGKIVELRFFGGLTIAETAAVLEISSDTVTRDWKLAKSWLAREMTRGE